MTSDQAKATFDTFIASVEQHVNRSFFRTALVDFQGFVDANWNAIFAALPATNTIKELIDGIFAQAKTMAAGQLWLSLLINLVQNAVDSYLQSNASPA